MGGEVRIMIKETPNKITAVLKVTATAEFFDDEASEETVRYCIEQDLEDAGFDVDVCILKEKKYNKMTDQEFLTHIIREICDFAVDNKMEPNDTLSTVADNIKALLEISTFNGWERS